MLIRRLAKHWWQNSCKKYWLCFLARHRGKCQMIAVVYSHNLAALLISHELKSKKRNWTCYGRVWWRGTSSEEEASLAWRASHTMVVIWRFWSFFLQLQILQTGLAEITETLASLMFHFTKNIQIRQQWPWACNLWFCATHNMGGLATPTPTTNNTPTWCPQQTTQYLSTGIKRKNLKKNNLAEHIKLIMGGWVETARFTHLEYHEWSETTCTLAYIRRHVSSAWQPVSSQQMAFHMRDHASSLLFSREEPLLLGEIFLRHDESPFVKRLRHDSLWRYCSPKFWT